MFPILLSQSYEQWYKFIEPVICHSAGKDPEYEIFTNSRKSRAKNLQNDCPPSKDWRAAGKYYIKTFLQN